MSTAIPNKVDNMMDKHFWREIFKDLQAPENMELHKGMQG